jgi:hypothetical protein
MIDCGSGVAIFEPEVRYDLAWRNPSHLRASRRPRAFITHQLLIGGADEGQLPRLPNAWAQLLTLALFYCVEVAAQ